MQNPNPTERQVDTPAIEYDNSRYQSLMKEYCELRTIGDCKKWKAKAQEIATYIGDIKSKVEPLIVADQEKLVEKLEQITDERDRMALQINAMHFANLGVFLQTQLDELTKVINSLPLGENDDKSINLPKEALTIAKQYVKTPFINPKIIGFIVVAIVIFLIWSFLAK